jgi:hypothetical protein
MRLRLSKGDKMPFKANEVLNGELLRLCGRVAVKPSARAKADAKVLRAQARLEQAKRRFPGLSDWEALDRLRDEDEDKSS